MKSRFINEQLKELDTPLKLNTSWLKNKKILLIIINEDGSANEYYKNYPESYIFEIKKLSYVLVPKCIIRGKIPTLVYFYNNPFPVLFDFEYTKLTAYDLKTSEQLEHIPESEKTTLKNTHIDAQTLNLAFNTRIMKGLYYENNITPKAIILIIGAILIAILIILQVTGVVDVWGMLTGVKK